MPAPQPALALTATGHSEQKSWKRNQDLVDALPYVDGLTAQEKQAVDALVMEEMRRSPKQPADYLGELPPAPSFNVEDKPMLAAELLRVAGGESLAAMSFDRYNLNPPPAAQRRDASAWQSALDNAYAQLEQQQNRLLNLELLLKFGPQTWRAHNEAVAAYVQRVQTQLGRTQAAIDELNRERKMQQTVAGRELHKLEEDYLALVQKNAEIEAACRALDAEVAALGGALGPEAAAAVAAHAEDRLTEMRS